MKKHGKIEKKEGKMTLIILQLEKQTFLNKIETDEVQPDENELSMIFTKRFLNHEVIVIVSPRIILNL